MVKANIIKKEVEVVTAKTTDVVILELSMEEAEIILALTQRVAGHPDGSYRGITDEIGETLKYAGVATTTPTGAMICRKYFKDDSGSNFYYTGNYAKDK